MKKQSEKINSKSKLMEHPYRIHRIHLHNAMYDYIGLNCQQKNNNNNNDNNNNNKIPDSKQCGKLSRQILRYKMSL